MTYPLMMELDPSTLRPNPWNTNIVTPENEAKLEESIKRFGFFRPVVVREIALSPNSETAMEILGGEHRAQIAVKLGLKLIPVINLGPIDDLKAKEIGIADNSRYGMDDQIAFAELIKGMGNAEQLKDFLPYTEHDFTDLFTTSEIDLDSLGLDENFEKEEEKDVEEAPVAPKPTKTHTIIRYKVANRDAEELTALIERTMKAEGFTSSDELTNAGDALVHLLLAPKTKAAAEVAAAELDDLDDTLAEGD